MPSYGVLSTGFSAKPLETIKEEHETALRGGIGSTLDLSTSSPWGQFVGIIASKHRELWELGQACYNASDPAAAAGAALAALSKVTGTTKALATKSEVTVVLNIDQGTYPAGTLVAHVSGNPDARFTNRDDAIRTPAGPSGDSDDPTVFIATVTGPVQALSGTLNIVAEPVTGFIGITNPLDADLGSDVESDPHLRARRDAEVASAGSTTLDAVRSDVEQLLIAEGTSSETVSVKVFGNDTDFTVGELPPHSLEVVLFDGDVPVDNDKIAQTIWNSKAAGDHAVGVDSGTATDEEGVEHIINFSRVTVLEVYVEIDVQTDYIVIQGVAAEDAVKAAIIAPASEGAPGLRWKIGQDVVPGRLEAGAFTVDGVEDVTEVRLGFAPSPIGTTRLTIAAREIAHILLANVTVNVSPFVET